MLVLRSNPRLSSIKSNIKQYEVKTRNNPRSRNNLRLSSNKSNMSILRIIWMILVVLIIPIHVFSMINDVRIISKKVHSPAEYSLAKSYIQASAFMLSNLFFKIVISFLIINILDVVGF